MTYLAHRYYTGKLTSGELPPDICLEISLWDRFGWGPEQTSAITQVKLREIFAILEQQRASKDAIDNLGSPDEARLRAKNVSKTINATEDGLGGLA